MSQKQKYVLGEPVPNNPHAVVSNVPTLSDVCAYEEKLDCVVSAMQQGYPRFVQHAWVNQLIESVVESLALEVSYAVLLQKNQRIQSFISSLDKSIQCISLSENDMGVPMDLVFIDAGEKDKLSVINALKLFIQHTGCLISSRMAEKALNHLGKLQSDMHEIDQSVIGHVKNEAQEWIRDLSSVESKEAVTLTSSGMNAFYSAFKALQSVQRAKGRSEWLQLGWVYVDSSNILQKYLSPEESLSVHYDILNTEAIVAKIEAMGDALSVVVLEFPTNPFCELADLKRISEAVWAQGGLVLVDPSILSIYNVNCTPYADVMVCSLTKYAGHTGDVMAGAIVLNEASRLFSELKDGIQANAIPLYEADLMALWESMREAQSSVESINQNTCTVLEFFKRHPKVKKVFSVSENQQHRSYLKQEHTGGSIVSIELEGSMEAFYDHLQLVKGPSFGTDFTIVCPYFYLAHYDLVLDTQPNNLLDRLGIDRNLIRISVGCEPIEELLGAFALALEAI